ncbi:MAG: hypothetical protein ACRC2K_10440 [Clostridium sp.]
MKQGMKDMYGKIKGKLVENKKIIISVGVIAVVLVVIISAINKVSVPTLTLKSPGKVELKGDDKVVIPAVMSNLPDNIYPAASVAISFDNSKLEFVELTIGTMKTYDDYDELSGEEPHYKIPQWTYNSSIANKEGEIRAMYLDTTAGKNAYNKEGFKKETQDIPFKLVFKVKDSVLPSEELKLGIKEAVFATVTGEVDKSTLSTKNNYSELKTKDATIKFVAP